MLAAAAERTTDIRLTSAVSVLSSDDPVRVFQQFATLDLLSGGRAEIMAGRGSFTESFPLFGYDLADYDALFAEKLDLLLAVRDRERVTWSGAHRAALVDQPVYPRPVQDPLPVWVAVGGNPQSVVRAGLLGLPLALAIIGGQPERFAPLAHLHRRALAEAGHDQGCRSSAQRARLRGRHPRARRRRLLPGALGGDEPDRARARLGSDEPRRVRRRRPARAARTPSAIPRPSRRRSSSGTSSSGRSAR